ncbi:pyruvate dehydrogenase complex dihydrolipoamide acetyltransferase [Sphingosinicella microcystinivorans]|uniref:Acetyltransferase component of pyruvate dehydrogenase complex n=1 Tax=Sphingosinicella microcystinivorans TaxID=335406 RepID=A0AAD1D6U0_SPHMI|nr:pyruvate dehydrogenase complex dihydrolipoamide acetyltransferase [Sphingosinicella microcystinivorans]RKS91986.1 pyruvate dehydrogenase E2 component (dihydrolipoamide acetyltransferase) [Sphingosinicella microcystinivorans]BBE34973.1 acetyltransferase component of pyruvate dehydrogenase complex [Sphingosinicella microcystinivorans]
MPIDITMPALSPTMETGTLAKWLVKEGDKVSPGDVIAEIETDKATMEVESIDEGVVAKIVVAAGTEDVPVGQLIAVLAEDGEEVSAPKAAKAEPKEAPKAAAPAPKAEEKPQPAPEPAKAEAPKPAAPQPAVTDDGDRVKASPLARRIAEAKGIDLGEVQGSGPGGRVVKADLDGGKPAAAAPAAKAAAPAAPAAFDTEIPHDAVKLSNMRKVIARRLTEAKQTIPHIYLTVDIQLDALLKLRGELNTALEPRGVKLSVNDLLIKALAAALIEVPECNVSISGDQLFKYSRADISVAVSIPNGLITPIITDADAKSLSAIATEMKELAGRAKEGKLQPHEYQGGTASISNMGMYGIKQFDAVINPPQGMIMAIGAGEKRPYIVNDALAIATVMSATGSFDHRAIDGADGARLMQAFKRLVENPLSLLA